MRSNDYKSEYIKITLAPVPNPVLQRREIHVRYY